MTKEETKKRLEKVIAAVAHDIEMFGLDALWSDGQLITGGTITVQINDEMVPTIEYKRCVLPGVRA